MPTEQHQTLYRFDAYTGNGIYWRTLPNGPWVGPFASHAEADANWSANRAR